MSGAWHRRLRLEKDVWRKRPFFWAAIFVVLGIAVPEFSGHLWWIPWIILVGFAGLLGSWRLFIGKAFVLGFVMFFAAKQREARSNAVAGFSGLGMVKIEAQSLEVATSYERGWSSVVKIVDGPGKGNKVLWRGQGAEPVTGSWLLAHGSFKDFSEVRNPGSRDWGKALIQQGVTGIFQASEMRSQIWTSQMSQGLAAIKKWFRAAIVVGLEEESTEAMLIRAIVLGERTPATKDLERTFRHSGTLHLFTVSGMHVAMFGGILWFLLKWAFVDRRSAVPVIIFGMFFYAWLTGNGPAAVRSAWMGAVYLAAVSFFRQSDLLNSMGAVLLATLLFRPLSLLLPGVQLSYGVVAAIGIGVFLVKSFVGDDSGLGDMLPKDLEKPLNRWWRISKLRGLQTIAISSAAWLGSIPLTIYHFGIITPASVFATVSLVPQVYMILTTSIVAGAVEPIAPPITRSLNRINGKIALLCEGTAKIFAQVPGAWMVARIPEREQLIIYDLDYGKRAASFCGVTGNSVIINTGGAFTFEKELAPAIQDNGLLPDSVIFTSDRYSFL